MPRFFEKPFELVSKFQPQGDQAPAIKNIVKKFQQNIQQQVLMGVTGSGKTFTMANVIAKLNMPTLILCHNKTLAAQLFAEFREFFPNNAVEYFVSYYDYYQPEAYIANTDTYIEKDSQINDEIDKLRHSATRALLERSDVIIVSSISCIYGLGSPEVYQDQMMYLEQGRTFRRQEFLKKLVEIQYQRNDVDFSRGCFRVRGDIVDIFPAYEEEFCIRVEFFDDVIEHLYEIDALSGKKIADLDRVTLYPATHYVTTPELRKSAMDSIREELQVTLAQLKNNKRIVEAQRLAQRTLYDLEMLEEVGFCSGIENYSRHMTGRRSGEAPPTLLEYFPKKWLLLVDESHVTIPQIGGMARGDRARKTNLVEHGFRLPSALDNRPLFFDEWKALLHKVLYVSATPGNYELELVNEHVTEQLIRPTGLLDPIVEVRPAGKQVQNLLKDIKMVVARNERVLVTTLTKKLAQDLANYYHKKGVRVKYLHSDIETLERVEILRDLRLGNFDVLIGINLLREGLDLPEVSLVAIFDADKEGFLRSSRSLIQTIGRAARNENGRVILYADTITKSMQIAIEETARRRSLQEAFNLKHGITPKTIIKSVSSPLLMDEDDETVSNSTSLLAKRVLKTGRGSGHGRSLWSQEHVDHLAHLRNTLNVSDIHEKARLLLEQDFIPKENLKETISIGIETLTQKMHIAAESLKFDEAALCRDKIKELKKIQLL